MDCHGFVGSSSFSLCLLSRWLLYCFIVCHNVLLLGWLIAKIPKDLFLQGARLVVHFQNRTFSTEIILTGTFLGCVFIMLLPTVDETRRGRLIGRSHVMATPTQSTPIFLFVRVHPRQKHRNGPLNFILRRGSPPDKNEHVDKSLQRFAQCRQQVQPKLFNAKPVSNGPNCTGHPTKEKTDAVQDRLRRHGGRVGRAPAQRLNSSSVAIQPPVGGSDFGKDKNHANDAEDDAHPDGPVKQDRSVEIGVVSTITGNIRWRIGGAITSVWTANDPTNGANVIVLFQW
mmetsp:Transcript_6866/g.13979  ORF Transcript_6866/g.13979 Transcript_6866/m.13979 type:complete len:285 (+) Transcript_6866:632-1486(+)